MVTKRLLEGKNVLVRADLDVPVEQGRVTNSYRLRAMLLTLSLCLENAKSTVVIGHLGRPKAQESEYSLKPIGKWLEEALRQSIPLIPSGFSPEKWLGNSDSRIALYDNLRFDKGELDNDRQFSELISAGRDLYIYEAFASYNDSASLLTIPELLPTYTGIQFDNEIGKLGDIVKTSNRPRILILSGAKDDKAKYVDNLASKFDLILIGGRLANQIRLDHHQPNILAANLTQDGFDIDDQSIELFKQKINDAQTIVINGPLGKFEDEIHAKGTKEIFNACLSSPTHPQVIIGGGDTLAAVPALGLDYKSFSFVSTGGGAMLEFMSTLSHPILEVIKRQSYAHT